MSRPSQHRPNVLRPRALAVALLACLLLASGCMMMPGWMGGGGRTTLDLDDGEAFQASLDVGAELALSMPQPGGGYELEGASFDPAVLDLSGFLRPARAEADEPGRAVYVFRALAPGKTAVEIRIRRPAEPGSAAEVYKTVQVVVEK